MRIAYLHAIRKRPLYFYLPALSETKVKCIFLCFSDNV